MSDFMRAWLVLWEWGSDSAAVADKIVTVLPPRWPNSRVELIVENIYASSTSTIGELAAYAKNPKNNPYRARTIDGGRIECGAHPFLIALPVKNLRITVDSGTGLEVISWHTMPVHRWNGEEMILASTGHPQSYRRQVKGPPSSELVWDRLHGRLKDGFDARDA